MAASRSAHEEVWTFEQRIPFREKREEGGRKGDFGFEVGAMQEEG
jgi:hypothetical protein